jgi:hypothetical protein
MPNSYFTLSRSETEVFADLKTVCTSPGYIHVIAYFCWRDNLIRYSGSQVIAEDLEHQHSYDKLSRAEIATLIGLMVQETIDLLLPEPNTMQGYIDRTEALLQELHQTLMSPWFEGWDPKAGKIPKTDPFRNAAAMREPIFYSGDAAYSFQYRELARLKYHADDEWLETNKGFRIAEACQIAETIGKLQLERGQKYSQSSSSPQTNGLRFLA